MLCCRTQARAHQRQSALWTDSLRRHSETPGFGIGESDEPFVLVAVIELERRNQVGISPTDMVLYGPLQGVDDPENHTLPFRPFWQRPRLSR
jgi:hypothetical protein